MTEIRALTIRQPHAQYVAEGDKTIETRSWRTGWRGTVIITAAKAAPPGCALPLGCAVAIAHLAEVLPISSGQLVPASGNVPVRHIAPGNLRLCPEWELALFTPLEDTPVPDDVDVEVAMMAEDVSDQLPLGDFTPGRFAWMLENVARFVQPIPCRGRQGLWVPDRELMARLDLADIVRVRPNRWR